MSFRRLDTLTAIAGKGYWLLLRCPCGYEARENPMPLALILGQRGASTKLRDLNRSLKCGRCGGKDFTAEHCNAPAMWSKR